MKKSLSLLSVMCLAGLALITSCGNKTSSSAVSSVAASSASSVSSAVEQALAITGEASIYVEGSTTLSVKCNGKNITATVTWSSSDATIATVTSAGKVTGVKAGKATITAAAAGYTSATFEITVKSNVQDITVAITPSFTSASLYSSVQTGYAIFFASSIDNWAKSIQCTLDTTSNTWNTTITGVPFDTTISYNTYYAKIGGSGWDLVNKESVDNAARSLSIVEGTLNYSIASSFEIPSTVASLAVTITPTMSDASALGDKVYVWAASNANSWTPVLCTKNTDGTFTFTDTNVAIGTGSYKVTLMLGSETSYEGWTYKASNVDGAAYDVTADQTTLAIAATFAKQPDYSSATYAIAFTFNCTDAGDTSAVQIVIDGTSWNKMTAGTNSYTYTANLTVGAHTYYFYNWYSSADHKVYADASSTAFALTVSAAASVTVTGSFATGLGTINA